VTAKRTSKGKTLKHLRVGDRVRFHFVDRWVVGTIIEDRGNLAFGGRRLLRVCAPRTDAEDLIIELPADELRAA
jgi:hypothetical protein